MSPFCGQPLGKSSLAHKTNMGAYDAKYKKLVTSNSKPGEWTLLSRCIQEGHKDVAQRASLDFAIILRAKSSVNPHMYRNGGGLAQLRPVTQQRC
jgi:hypothetical protein